ncbi:MAG TPA: hypothetical protein DDZ89_09510, partial [Clostridiales bacterium]|nr:hypothetical protein [Clostridiales bacterium]
MNIEYIIIAMCLIATVVLFIGCSQEDTAPAVTDPEKQEQSSKEQTTTQSETTKEKFEETEPKPVETQIDIMETATIKSLGVASNSAEARSGAIVRGSDGKFYAVLPSLGFLVCYDFEKDTSTQHLFENNTSGAPFKSFASQAGKFYTGANAYFYEFDPVVKEFTAVIHMGEWGATQTGWGFCEDDDGIIYFADYPKLYLYAFNPTTKEIKNYGLIDETQMYCFSQAADSSGWVYSAIGTAEVNV